MSKFVFNPESVKRGFALAKLVRPIINDYILHFSGKTLSITSCDRRRFCRAEIVALSGDVPDDYSSDDYYLSADRHTLLDSDLSSMSISITDKGLNVKYEDEGHSKSALIKKRNENSKRPKIMTRERPFGGISVNAENFENLMRQVSCSALVKETKTEDDMRINQVHFFPDDACAYASARTYATVAFMKGLNLDLSIVSADIPTIRSFCAKSKADEIIVGSDQKSLFLIDPNTNSYLTMSRVNTSKPTFDIFDSDGYATEIEVPKAILVSSFSWAKTAIEGTARLSISAIKSADSDSGVMEMSADKQEITNFPVKFRKGKELRGDFKVDMIANLAAYVDDDTAVLKYSHDKLPTLLELTSATIGDVYSRHFIQSMKDKQ
jgi:hypothetical protein